MSVWNGFQGLEAPVGTQSPQWSPPDFLAVVVADEEGDGGEEEQDGAQDDHQHLLVGEPALRRAVGEADLVPHHAPAVRRLQVDVEGGAAGEDLHQSELSTALSTNHSSPRHGGCSCWYCRSGHLGYGSSPPSRHTGLVKITIIIHYLIIYVLTYFDIVGRVVAWFCPWKTEFVICYFT